MRVCSQLRRPGPAKMIYLENDHSKSRRPTEKVGPGNHGDLVCSTPRPPPLSFSLHYHVPLYRPGFPQPPPGQPMLPTPFWQALLHLPPPSPASRVGAPPAWEALRPPASLVPSPEGLLTLTLPFRCPHSPPCPQFPLPPSSTSPSPPPPPLAPAANGVSSYLGHRRRWSAPRWPSRCPTGSRRTSVGDPWRCGGGTGGRDGARSLRKPLAAGLCPGARGARSAGSDTWPLRKKNPKKNGVGVCISVGRRRKKKNPKTNRTKRGEGAAV